MEKQLVSPPAEKLLIIERDVDQELTPLSEIPEEYLRLSLPFFRIYFKQDEDCDMLCQHIWVKEFSIWGHDILAKKPIKLKPRTPHLIFALHYMHEDSIDAVIDQMGPFKLKAKQVNLFSLDVDFHTADLNYGCKIFSFHINIHPDALPKLAEKYPVLQNLLKLDLTRRNCPLNENPYQINVICDKILERMFTCRYVELQAECLLYRCCVNLFENFARQDAQYRLTNGKDQLSEADTALMEDVFGFVLENYRHPKIITELTNRFKQSEEALNSAFEYKYATPLHDFIRQQRMDFVYDQMMKTEHSFSSIAWKAGYPNRRAMVADFASYFEEDPIRVRNAQ